MSERFFVTPSGQYIGSYILPDVVGAEGIPLNVPLDAIESLPLNAVEVFSAPPNARAIWLGGQWVEVISTDDIDREKERRLRLPMTFQGSSYDMDSESVARITGAAALAGFAAMQGAGPGNFYWHGGSEPFRWITSENASVQMDAPTMFAFGQAAAAFVANHVFAARQLKDTAPIPADYKSDTYWPA